MNDEYNHPTPAYSPPPSSHSEGITAPPLENHHPRTLPRPPWSSPPSSSSSPAAAAVPRPHLPPPPSDSSSSRIAHSTGTPNNERLHPIHDPRAGRAQRSPLSFPAVLDEDDDDDGGGGVLFRTRDGGPVDLEYPRDGRATLIHPHWLPSTHATMSHSIMDSPSRPPPRCSSTGSTPPPPPPPPTTTTAIRTGTGMAHLPLFPASPTSRSPRVRFDDDNDNDDDDDHLKAALGIPLPPAPSTGASSSVHESTSQHHTGRYPMTFSSSSSSSSSFAPPRLDHHHLQHSAGIRPGVGSLGGTPLRPPSRYGGAEGLLSSSSRADGAGVDEAEEDQDDRDDEYHMQRSRGHLFGSPAGPSALSPLPSLAHSSSARVGGGGTADGNDLENVYNDELATFFGDSSVQ